MGGFNYDRYSPGKSNDDTIEIADANGKPIKYCLGQVRPVHAHIRRCLHDPHYNEPGCSIGDPTPSQYALVAQSGMSYLIVSMGDHANWIFIPVFASDVPELDEYLSYLAN